MSVTSASKDIVPPKSRLFMADFILVFHEPKYDHTVFREENVLMLYLILSLSRSPI